MIKSLTATNYRGESITMELLNPQKTGLAITDITGLGPVRADINCSENSNEDGSLYNSSRIGYRNIVIDISFLDIFNIESLRQLTYKIFPIKKRIKLLIRTEHRECYILGFVESNEPNIFSSMESTQISIICPDPYFRSEKIKRETFLGIENAFEFPFENNSLVSNEIEFGKLLTNPKKNIVYSGDSETGMVITMHALGDVSNITIYNLNTREAMKINTEIIKEITGKGIVKGDDIIINTYNGQKSIVLYRDGLYVNILNCLDLFTDWFKLRKGDNLFSYTAELGANHIRSSIEYQDMFEGL